MNAVYQPLKATNRPQIHDIQGYLESDEDGDKEEYDDGLFSLRTGPDLALDTTRALTLQDVCKALPLRPVADKLLAFYYNSGLVQNRQLKVF